MLRKIEILAEQIVDFLDSNKKKKQKKESKKSQTNKITKIEELENSYYEIIPYHKNNFDYKTFSKLLKNFSYFSKRINFYTIWNNTSVKLIISFPTNFESKFVNNFYNYFPSSKINKIEFNENIELKTYIHAIWDDKIKLKKSKSFFKEIFFLFKDIPSSDKWIIKYSIILNSSWEIHYESLFELIWKWIKLFLFWIYYFFVKVFTWVEPKIKKVGKKQKMETWIKWTALSIWVGGYSNFDKLFFKNINEATSTELYTQDEEVFSAVEILEFSKFFHVPTEEENIKWIEYIKYKRLAPPSNLPEKDEDITVLWKVDWADEKQIVWLRQEDKARHVYIIWKTWVGKSTLLSNMVLSDLERGRGLALIDPHGDLAENILQVIPENRKDDVIYFNVSDIENPVGFNVFEKWENYNKDLSVSTILSIFKKLYWNSWGPRLEYIFRNTLLALSDYNQANFLHIMKMLTDKTFRKEVLAQTTDPVIKDFWEKEFTKRSERFASEAISPIMNKVWQFVSSPIIRNIFWQTKSTINISDIMQNNKILLVNLSKWLIWEDNSAMIGSFIVSQIQVETMKRANLPMNQREEFTLYIDEFQNFATDSFSVILSEARKYKLSLAVANQYISQIDKEVRNAIFGNIWNLVVFNSGNEDAEILSKQFKNQITANDISSIPKFKAYTKIMIDGTSTDVFWIATQPILDENIKNNKFIEEIKQLSKSKYTKSRQDVEKEIWESIKTQNEKNIEKQKWKVENNYKWWIINNKIEQQDLVGLKNKNNWEWKTKNTIKKMENNDIDDIFEWVVKLKFNYGLFVVAWWYEWLLHKKNINLPEWINWKDYYNIWDKVRVKLTEIKEVDGQKKAVWENV